MPEHGVRLQYDGLGRVVSKRLMDEADGYLTNYEFVQGGQGVGSSSTLIRSIVQDGKSFEYAYDELGNITRESRNGIEAAISEVVYAYEDANLKDKSTSIGGVPIDYDAIGNPLKYGKWTYTWKAGRKLIEMNSTDGEALAFE